MRSVILLFVLLSASAYAQNKPRIDTVYATTNKTTTLVFPDKVVTVDLGSEDFGYMKSGNLVLVKAAIDNASPTTILVQYGANNDFYHGTLSYTGKLKEALVEFAKKEIPKLPNENRVNKDDSLKSLEQDLADKRLNILLADTKERYKTIAYSNEKLLFTLSNMMTDDEHVYLKFLFENSSKIDYQIDFAEFVYQDPIEKGELKGTYDKKNVYAVATNKIDGIRAKDQRFLGYCIPRYALSRKGKLVVIIREKAGSRLMELTIPFVTIMEAPTVNKNKI